MEEERAEEAPESEAEGPAQEETVLEEIKEKQTLRNNLHAQLKRLQADMAKLEGFLSSMGADTSAKVDSKLLSLLTTTNPSCAKTSPTSDSPSLAPQFTNPIQLGEKPLPYLQLFAPGNLQLSTRTISRTSKSRLQTLQILTLSAPPPWPPQMFSAVFEVLTDAVDARIESVKLKQPRRGSWSATHHKPLYNWIYSRLEDPLHKLDIGTIVWGMGRYFDECITRAKSLHRLDCLYNMSDVGEAVNFDNKTDLSSDDAKALIPYMASFQLEINAPPPNGKRKCGRLSRIGIGPKMLLSWVIELDWTGEVHTRMDVAASGVSRKVQEVVKGLFGKLERRKGVVGAMGDIWGLVTRQEWLDEARTEI